MASRFIYTVIFLLSICLSNAQISKTDSLAALAHEVSNDSSTWTKLIGIANELIAKGDLPAAIDLSDKFIFSSQAPQDQKKQLFLLRQLVDACINHGNYRKAMEYSFHGKKLAESLGERSILAGMINSIGIIYWYEGENKKALTFYEDALKISIEIGDDKQTAGLYNNLGILYRQTKEYDKAIEYYKRSIVLCEKTHNERSLANAYNNIGIIYEVKKEYASALKSLGMSLDIRKKINDEIGIATSLGNIGGVYFSMKKYKEALDYFKESFAISRRLDDKEGVKEMSEYLSDLYKITGRSDEALTYYKIFIGVRDSLVNEATKREALRREIEYKYEKEQEKRSILDEAEKRKQRIFTFSIFTILVLISVFAILLMKRFRVTSRQKKIIEEKNKEILDSIHYARRIQNALLPGEKYIERYLKGK